MSNSGSQRGNHNWPHEGFAGTIGGDRSDWTDRNLWNENTETWKLSTDSTYDEFMAGQAIPTSSTEMYPDPWRYTGDLVSSKIQWWESAKKLKEYDDSQNDPKEWREKNDDKIFKKTMVCFIE